MDKTFLNDILSFLYGADTAKEYAPRFLEVIENSARLLPKSLSGVSRPPQAGPASPEIKLPFSHKDAFLISYGNMLSTENAASDAADETGLARLYRFLEKRNKGAFTYLHILPFHPYSSDDGFSVIDYRRVDERFGTWEDIARLQTLPLNTGTGGAARGNTDNGTLRLAFDLVVNHGSVQSEWFKAFLRNEEPYRDWYLTRPADYDFTTVVRPRTHPLLTSFAKSNGESVPVWTTFSADQVDYDFSNPRVLLEFVTILLEYARRGAGIVRLDAIAYLWKEDGTPCLHHPKTHAVVRLFRAIIDYLELPLLILTETNVPHAENISYFGAPVGNAALDALPEAHMVYNFALPPLVLYAALSGDAVPLRNWAKNLEQKEGRYFLNFLASHDGVGLTPARGLVDDAAFAAALEEAKRSGALVSYKSTPQGDIPYELNCSYASIVAPPELGTAELRARAFCAAYAVLLSLSGLPAVYFHSWIGSEAWTEGPSLLGYNRAINREKPALEKVENELDNPRTFRFHAHRLLNAFLSFRQNEPVFNPDIPQYVPNLGAENKSLFAIFRGPSKDGRRVLCVENLGGEKILWQNAGSDVAASGADFSGAPFPPQWNTITLLPWETRWLVWDKNGEASAISSYDNI